MPVPSILALIPGNTIPLQVQTETIRSTFGVHKNPNISERITSQEKSSGVTSYQCQVQITATIPFSHFKRA